jgi:hypothetical protein
MYHCEQHALAGDIKAIKTTLQELITVKTRSKQIGNLLRLAFRTEIDNKIGHKEYSSAQGLIYSYIDIFGLDKELQKSMQEYESITKRKLAITVDTTHRMPRDNWLHNKLIVGSY